MTCRNHPAWVRRRRRGAVEQDAVEALALALAVGDGPGIRALLRSDAVLVIDGGGVVPAPEGPVRGPDRAAAGLAGLMTPETSITMAAINGMPGFVLQRDESVVAVVTAEARAGRLASLWVVCNPEKLRHWNR